MRHLLARVAAARRRDRREDVVSESAGVLIVCAVGGGLVAVYVAIDWAGKRFEQWVAQRAAGREAAYQAWCERVGEPPSEHLEHAMSLRDRIAAARERRAERALDDITDYEVELPSGATARVIKPAVVTVYIPGQPVERPDRT
jgi:hypothetical protein